MSGNALDRLLALKGKTRSDFSKRLRLGSIFRSKGVANTPELQRILELPEYVWHDDEDLQEVATWIREEYGKPVRLECRRKCGHRKRQKPQECAECDRAARACPCQGEGEMYPRLIQAAALMSAHDFGGLIAPIRVGGGKTLLSYLLGLVMGRERVLLLVPAKLKPKTKREFEKLARHWHGAKRMHVMSYELLARDRGLAELEAFRPDLVIADEGQKLKSKSAACTKRVRRYLQETNPECAYVDMSGTFFTRSIMEMYHRQNWALQDGLQPLPRKFNEARDWADAIDEKVSPTGRLMPGALFQFYSPEELAEASKDHRKSTQVRIVRQAFQRRLMSTPGIVGTNDQFDGAMPLILSENTWKVGPNVVEAFERLRTTWELPDGQPIEDPPTLWRAARCLIQGFYYKWDPEAPPEWMMWRKEWSKTVRSILADYRRLDTALQVRNAVERGEISWAKPILDEWSAVRPTFKPRNKAFWIDDGAFNHLKTWARKNVGIIWVHETALGERLHKEAGIPYFGAKGLCNGKMIEDETRSCVASIMANGEGRNLQHYSKNYIAAPPPGGSMWEQMFGRTHRDGQYADEVTGEIALGCYENWKVVMQAFRDAEFMERAGGQDQKLNFADVDLPGSDEVEGLADSGDPLWSKDNADFFKDNDQWSRQEFELASLSPAERALKRQDAFAGLNP